MPEENTKRVKTTIQVECKGESIRRVVYEDWWGKLSLEEIAETTVEAVGGIE